MKTRKFEITNDFHGRTVTLRVIPAKPLTRNQVLRAKRELCGIKECRCSDEVGARGPQPDNDGLQLQDDWTSDGDYAPVPVIERRADYFGVVS